MTRNTELAGKIILVTGASRGIGYATAIEAAQRGAHVIALARTVGGLEALDNDIQSFGGTTTLVPLDLADGDGIDRMGMSIFERWGRLDGLVINGAILGPISPIAHISPKHFAQVMDINVTSAFRLIRSLDLPLRKAEAGRIVFLSSGAANTAKPFWGLYAASKAALNALAKSLAGELVNTPLRVNVFYPGVVRTAMRAKAMPGEDPATLPAPAEIAPEIVNLLSPELTQTGQIYDVRTGGFREI